MLSGFLNRFLTFTGGLLKQSLNPTRRQFLILSGGSLIMGKYLSPHFTVEECQCSLTKSLPWDHGLEKDDFLKFLDLLEAIRKEWGNRAIWPSSIFRSSEHNQAISKTGKNGPHTGLLGGYACDIKVSGGRANDLIKVALSVDLPGINRINGIGIKQNLGLPHNRRFIHIDNIPTHEIGGKIRRPAQWSYPA